MMRLVTKCVLTILACVFLANELNAAQLLYGNIVRIKNTQSGKYVIATGNAAAQSATNFALTAASKVANTNKDGMWEIGPLSSKGQPVVTGSSVILRSIGQDYYMNAPESLMDSTTFSGPVLGESSASDPNNNWLWAVGDTGMDFYLCHINSPNIPSGTWWRLNWDGTAVGVSSKSLSTMWFLCELVAQDESGIPVVQTATTPVATTTSNVTTTVTPVEATVNEIKEKANDVKSAKGNKGSGLSWYERREAMVRKQQAGKSLGKYPIQKRAIQKTTVRP